MKLLKQNLIITALVFFVSVSFFNCGNNAKQNTGNDDTQTSGTVHITVDEEFKPLFDSMITAFEGTYKNAHLIVSYKPEAEAIKDFYSDSVRLVIIPRKLRDDELSYFKEKGFTPPQILVAKDGIAFIVNNENPDSTIYREELYDILQGKTTDWKKLRDNNFSGEITVITDNPGSSAARFVHEDINKNGTLPKNIYSAKTNEEVIDYVKKNKYAIGIIGVNWVSDWHDSKTLQYRQDVKVVKTTGANDSIKAIMSKHNYFWIRPEQSFVYLHWYPFIRELYIINIEGKRGLGTGFAAYAAAETGQLIVEHAGLLPAHLPTRVISNH